MDEKRKKKKTKKRRLTKQEVIAKLQKAVDIVREREEIDINTLAFFVGVSPYFLGKNIGLMLELFEDLRYDPFAKTFYILKGVRTHSH